MFEFNVGDHVVKCDYTYCKGCSHYNDKGMCKLFMKQLERKSKWGYWVRCYDCKQYFASHVLTRMADKEKSAYYALVSRASGTDGIYTRQDHKEMFKHDPVFCKGCSCYTKSGHCTIFGVKLRRKNKLSYFLRADECHKYYHKVKSMGAMRASSKIRRRKATKEE